MTKKNLLGIEQFPVQVQMPIAYVDMGMFDHVNNANYFRYFENARAQLFDDAGISALYEQTGIGGILAEVKCKFLKPLAYPDKLTVGARVSAIGQTSLTIEYLIVSEKLGVAALGEGILVMYDYKKAQKTNVPAQLITAIQAMESCCQAD